jgi:hypothetical protein
MLYFSTSSRGMQALLSVIMATFSAINPAPPTLGKISISDFGSLCLEKRTKPYLG